MSEDIDNLIKPVKKNGELVTHRDTDPDLGCTQYLCSTYIEKQNILVKGESKNKSKSRKALLVFFDLGTGEIIGELMIR